MRAEQRFDMFFLEFVVSVCSNIEETTRAVCRVSLAHLSHLKIHWSDESSENSKDHQPLLIVLIMHVMTSKDNRNISCCQVLKTKINGQN